VSDERDERPDETVAPEADGTAVPGTTTGSAEEAVAAARSAPADAPAPADKVEDEPTTADQADEADQAVTPDDEPAPQDEPAELEAFDDEQADVDDERQRDEEPDEEPSDTGAATDDEPTGPTSEPPTTEAPTDDAATAAATAAAAPAPSSAPNGWVVLGRALAPRSTKAQLLAGALCALLGFALVVQVHQNNGTNLEGMRQADLVRMLDETTDRSDALQRQASDLQAEHDQLLSGSDRRQAALDALRRTATTQGILTGRLPAQGPGIVLTLSEPSGSIRPLTLLDVLEEMRNSGAEAIELNGHRITASSAFTGEPGAVVLDGATLQAPFRWLAIGDPDTIATALQIPGGALAAVRNDGGQGTVARSDLVKVTAIRVLPDPVYATPAPAATP
jgi:uncharacterized protein YlxW (UPF0749 family)